MPSSRGSSRPKDGTWVSCTAGRFFTTEPPEKPFNILCCIKYTHTLHSLSLRDTAQCQVTPVTDLCVDNQWVTRIKGKWCHWGWKTVLPRLFGWLPAREEALHRLLSKQPGWCVPVEEATCWHLPREEVGWLRSCAESIWRLGNKGPSIYRSFSATTPRPK